MSEQKTNLSCGIVGLPNVGKSTLFSALTKKQVSAENYPFCTIDPNVGVIEIQDPRLQELAKISHSKKIVNATVMFVDIAGLVKGAAKGEGLGNQFLSHIKETDTIIHVVRCFEHEKVIHVGGKIDPIDDMKTIELELILADLQAVEKILLKMQKMAKGKKELQTTIDTLEKVKNHLNEEKPLRSLSLTDEEKEVIHPFSFITIKKVIYVANVHEDDLPSMENKYVKMVQEYANNQSSPFLAICGKLEEELAQLEEKDAEEFLQSLGLKESGLDRLAKLAFKEMGLITYITTGELETKAWTIRKGSTAPTAAGKIHGDLEKGFIRAEVVSYNDMISYKGRVGARVAGKARSEGKTYQVQDGDVILFYHQT